MEHYIPSRKEVITMELRNIMSFLKVNESGSFSKAAIELGYTQSNISAHILQLEKELGHSLFDRIGKKIYLTEYGQAFLPYAYDIKNTVEHAKQTLDSDSLRCSEIKLGILESLCITYLPDFVLDFHKQISSTNIVIKIGTFDELSEMLNKNQIDLLWTFDQQISPSSWVKALEYSEPIHLICSPTHKLLKKECCELTDLTNEEFIFTESSCSYRSLFESILKANKIPYHIFMEIGNTEIIKKFVHTGLCLSILPSFAINNEIATHTINLLQVKDLSMTMYSQIFYHKNKYLTSSMDQFLELLKTHLQKD